LSELCRTVALTLWKGRGGHGIGWVGPVRVMKNDS